MPPQQQQTREQFVKSLFVLENEDNIYTEKEARKKLIKGVDKCVDSVKISYGPSGSNVILEAQEYPGHRVSNDGKRIVDSIKLADPVENIGANIVKEVASKSDKESGDGRKTSMILLQAILKEGAKATESPMEIKRSLDECLPIILKSIDDQTKKITIKEVGKVAEIASESVSLGKTFGEIYKSIGKDGIIELDTSGTEDTYFTVTEGVRLLNCKYQYSYMADAATYKATREHPYVLITKEKINNIGQVDPIFKTLYRQGKKDIVIFCDEIADEVSSYLYGLHQGITKEMEGTVVSIKFNVLVIKAPTLWKPWLFEDFAAVTGATIVDGTLLKLKGLQPHHFGTCDKVISSKEETVVLGIKDISEHIKVIEEANTDDSKLRSSRLRTKTAILKLGASSESELSLLMGKALDARNASYLALTHGVVEGGGISFDRCSLDLADLENQTTGTRILRQALCYPKRQILENGNVDEISEEIFDPSVVVKNAITNALSVASTILTTKIVITLKK